MAEFDQLQSEKIKAAEAVERYIPTLENKSLDPTLTHKMISLLIKQNNLPQYFKDNLNDAYTEVMKNEIKAHVSLSPEQQEMHVDKYKIILKELLGDIDNIEENHKQYNRKRDFISIVTGSPEHGKVNEFAKELMEDYKDKDAFKNKFIEAYTESQQLEDKKLKFKEHHKILIKAIGKDTPDKRIFHAKADNAAQHIEERITDINISLKSDLVGFLKHQEIQIENNKDKTKEIELLNEKFINKLSSYYKEQNQANQLSEKTESLQKHSSLEDKIFEELDKASSKEQKSKVFENMMTMHKNITEGKSFVEKINSGLEGRSLR